MKCYMFVSLELSPNTAVSCIIKFCKEPLMYLLVAESVKALCGEYKQIANAISLSKKHF